MRSALLLVLFSSSAMAQDLGLDLTDTADVEHVLVIPPVIKVAVSQGAFAGMGPGKTVDKFDLAALKALVTELSVDVGDGKIVSTEATTAALAKVKPATLKTEAGIGQLAKDTNAQWVVAFEVNKTDLNATVFNGAGAPMGIALNFPQSALLSQTQLKTVGTGVANALISLTKPKETPAVAAKPTPVVVADATVAPESTAAENAPAVVTPIEQPDQTVLKPEYPVIPKVVAAVGGGYSLRQFSSGRDIALSNLQGSGTGGFAVFASVNPLQFIASTANTRWSDLHVDLNYRRGFLSGTSSQGTPCTSTDDDIAVRLGYRIAVGGNHAPSLGLGVGWSQERTTFSCSDPLVNTEYRGVDLQLKARQPIIMNKLAFELAVGPRFLIPPTGATAGFSLGGEAWLTATPVSVLFVRGGGRFVRAQMSAPALSLAVTDLRIFVGLEIGAFL